MRTPTVRTVVLTASEVAILPVSGRAVSVLSSTSTFTIRVNNGPAQPMTKGRGFGSPTSDEFDFLEITDTSGAGNTIVLSIGDEQITGADQLLTILLDSASILSITPAAQTLNPGSKIVNNANTPMVFANCKNFFIAHTGAVGTFITLTLANGDTDVLSSGETRDWGVFRHQDKLASITVTIADAATGKVQTLS